MQANVWFLSVVEEGFEAWLYTDSSVELTQSDPWSDHKILILQSSSSVLGSLMKGVSKSGVTQKFILKVRVMCISSLYNYDGQTIP